MGESDWMVVEADESDGTFVKLPSTIAIVTNMDPEHLDFYGTFEAEKEAFKQFIDRVPFYGAAVLCIDHPEVQGLIKMLGGRRYVTSGLSAQADVRAVNVRSEAGVTHFDVEIKHPLAGTTAKISDVRLPMPGDHNVQNALAAITAGLEMRMRPEQLAGAFANFSGVKRRFTKTGEAAGVTIIDDYGHHPVEIAAVLKAARQSYNKDVIAVVQPHRYTRLQSLFDEFCTCFNDADTVIVTPVFEAGEQPIEGADQAALVDGLLAHGHRRVMAVAGPDDLPQMIKDIADSGDVVVCLGAGSISAWANALPAQLQDLTGKEASE